MAIQAEELQEIETLLTGAEADGSVLAALRLKFPHLKWSRCDASDVLEEPYRSFPAYDLHLMDASNHCVAVVADPAAASGAILATRSVTR
ncbi:DUF6129 family protein [Rhodoblastus acidophilus]|uniref:DUF6129 family protein n=1 Tax=Candidatus Rhodoblastus alkanivorans TaxID=2954117 RepID=A0ABS9ZAJ4_9HYPH|nr:DUF6129 family protein [Candidatus Rhodoblastus alkanivorans]MCI4677088.1 DUF6129 family protein [Candidatus Rhodoblastus alkanivorans]MCI4684441.1 DUF6129 family protein [Candidatus Rhodoblastus alkanivorans]MDI4641762.1 DUF6129 family protein [Rhodoblastus acidophilus]